MKTNRINANILMITNDPVWRETSCRLLSGLGLEVTVAQNGCEAFYLMEKICFDLALLETDLPGMDGIEVLGLLKARHARFPILVCLSDGDTDAPACERLFRLGAQGVMKKDRTATELVPVVMALLIILDLKKTAKKPQDQKTSFLLSNLN